MKDNATLIEYGTAIDPQTMVTPPDVTELELEPGHPGLGDEGYVQRRKELFALCRKHRLERLGPPLIEYTAEETRIWREVSPMLDELHQKYACDMYLQAKRDLTITRDEIPQTEAPQRPPEERDEHAPGPGRGRAALSHLLRVHRRARLPGDAVHPPRVASGVHARTGHDPRLSRPRAAAHEPGLCRAAHAHRQSRGGDTAWRPGARPQAV